MTDDVLCHAGWTFCGLEQMCHRLSDRVENVAMIEAEVRLQSAKSLSDGLTTLTVFVFRCAVDEVAIGPCALNEPVQQTRNLRMNRNKAISRCRLVRHLHEADLGIWINPNIRRPKLRDAFDTCPAECGNSDGGGQRVVALGFCGLLNAYHVLWTKPLPLFILRLSPACRVSDPTPSKWISIIWDDLVRLHPLPVVANLSRACASPWWSSGQHRHPR